MAVSGAAPIAAEASRAEIRLQVAVVSADPTDKEKVIPLDTIVSRMARVFVGNQSWHYTADFRNVTIEAGGKRVPRYKDVQGPPSAAEFVDHLNGDRGLLVIPITKAGACRWGKIDVDVYDTDPKKWAAKIARQGLPLIVELSKSGGVHLAHYSPHTQSAHDLRAKLADWAAALNCPPKVEIFPKQEKLLDGEQGNGINLPYFGGEEAKNFAIDKDGNKLTVSQWLDAIERMPANATHTPGEVNVEAAAELLARHWTDGQRDNLSLAAGGALIRARVDTSMVQEILTSAQGIAADPGNRKSAEQIARDVDNNKRVPGYPALVELIGTDDAKELMRLAGGKPPIDPLPFSFAPTSSAWRTEAPEPMTYCIEPLLPAGVVGMLVAEGGAGKTSFAMRMATSVAGGREFFGMPTAQGRVVYIACEEHMRGLRRRYHWIAHREVEKMMADKASPDEIARFEANLDANLTLISAVGYELHLVIYNAGQVMQGAIVDALIERLPRPLELLVLDPISRLNGAEENSNSVGTAMINAAERIAREAQCTILLPHHTGKSNSKERDTSQYAARGASGFVDAARSSIRLIQADANAAKDFANVPPEVIARGDLVQVIHNKLNEGKRAESFWLRRQELDFDLFVPQAISGAQRYDQLLLALFNWFVGENARKGFSQRRVADNAETRGAAFAPYAVSRDRARETFARALDSGDLLKAEKNPACDTPLLVFRAGFQDDSM